MLLLNNPEKPCIVNWVMNQCYIGQSCFFLGTEASSINVNIPYTIHASSNSRIEMDVEYWWGGVAKFVLICHL